MYKIIGANQVEYGPINADQVRQWIAEGRINAQTLAQAEGETNWRPITSFPEFAASFPAAPGPQTPGAGPMPGAYPVNADMGRSHALEQVNVPAIGLIVTGGLGIAISLLGILKNAMGKQELTTQQTQALQGNPQLLHFIQSIQGFSGPLGILLNLIAIAVSIFVIFGAIKMRRLEGYGLAMAASIIAMIPFCSPCCCVGIVFGIWGIIVLCKADVKSYFS